VGPAEHDAVAALPDMDRGLREELLLGATENRGALLAERVMLPALNVHGIRSGAVGPEATNSIPTEARASLDFRLVPNQTPERVRERIEAHFAKQGWTVVHDSATAAERLAHPRVLRVAWEGGYAAYRLPVDDPAARAVRGALDEWLGHPVLVQPMLGGSLPMCTFAGVLGVPLVTVPIANHDDAQHARDENVRLQNLWDGVEIYAAIMTRAAAHWPR
jgi:acetylornithine deacetylase/succinyl-diaminopimelate desuccinylase-like protein